MKMRTIHSQPLVSVFAFRQLYDFPQAVAAESSFRKLLQLPRVRAFRPLLRLKRLITCASIIVAVVGEKVSLLPNVLQSMSQASEAVLHVVCPVLGVDWHGYVAGEVRGVRLRDGIVKVPLQWRLVCLLRASRRIDVDVGLRFR